MFIKSSLRGQKVHKSMNFVHDLATLLIVIITWVAVSSPWKQHGEYNMAVRSEQVLKYVIK